MILDHMNSPLYTKTQIDQYTYDILGAAIEVHKQIGPGLMENIYQLCMNREMSLRGYEFQRELIVPVIYKGLQLETPLRCDFQFAGCIAVELKAAKAIEPVFQAQLITYMNLLNVPKGILINFNVTNIIKEGQKTFVNELFRYLPD